MTESENHTKTRKIDLFHHGITRDIILAIFEKFTTVCSVERVECRFSVALTTELVFMLLYMKNCIHTLKHKNKGLTITNFKIHYTQCYSKYREILQPSELATKVVLEFWKAGREWVVAAGCPKWLWGGFFCGSACRPTTNPPTTFGNTDGLWIFYDWPEQPTTDSFFDPTFSIRRSTFEGSMHRQFYNPSPISCMPSFGILYNKQFIIGSFSKVRKIKSGNQFEFLNSLRILAKNVGKF